MLKAFCKNLIWIAAPMALAVGCCGPRQATQGSVFSTLAPDNTLVATSAYEAPHHRIYAAEDAIGPGNAADQGVDAVPAGANPQTWAIAQQIQDKLISDPTLAPMGSSLVTQVGNDGVVTLRGSVASTDEQQRVSDSISTLPGVKSVNNQLTIGRASTSQDMNIMYPLQ